MNPPRSFNIVAENLPGRPKRFGARKVVALGTRNAVPFAGAARSRIRAATVAVLAAVAIAAVSLAPVRASAADKISQVYLIRGFLGVFSTGLDELARELNGRDIRSEVFSYVTAGSHTANIRKAYASNPRSLRHIVIVGHSFGADAALHMAAELGRHGIKVDLVVTIDPTVSGPLSPSVRNYLNYYLSKNVLGKRLSGSGASSRSVTNIDIRTRPNIVEDGTGHWTMTTNKIILREVRQKVLRAVR